MIANISLTLTQLFFTLISIFFSVNFTINYFDGGTNWVNIALGVLGGALLSGILYGLGLVLKRLSLRTFNTAVLGLFFGYQMAEAILLSSNAILGYDLASSNFMPLRFFIFLISTYLGLIMTLQASEEIRVSIPFFDFKLMGNKKKDILVDISILSDSRIIDLASTGLLDHHLIIPRFAIRDLYTQAESSDEIIKTKARRSLDLIKKLENLPFLDLKYIDTDFSEIKDPMAKLIRLARFMDTHIITSDLNRIQQSSVEGVRIINIHMLSNALKPVTQAGEVINIKIQRYGKEARQGVGYLEDGTMVVVNGGAEFIGETIKAYVLSVKHTSSGRMVFCNASEEGCPINDNDFQSSSQELETSKTLLNL